jgi:hypothetical protein
MSKIFLKRINKEIQNFYEKKYLENNNFSNHLMNFLDNLKVEIVIGDYGYNEKCFLLIKNILTDTIILELKIPETYPFKPYSVVDYNSIFLNNSMYFKKNYYNYDQNYKISYSKYMNNVYEKIKHKDKKIYQFFYNNLYGIYSRFLNLEKNSCYCCSSIVCNDLWTPSITFNNIIFDHLEIQFIEKYSSNLNYKYLQNIYNRLHTSELFIKLPDELINKILN